MAEWETHHPLNSSPSLTNQHTNWTATATARSSGQFKVLATLNCLTSRSCRFTIVGGWVGGWQSGHFCTRLQLYVVCVCGQWWNEIIHSSLKRLNWLVCRTQCLQTRCGIAQLQRPLPPKSRTKDMAVGVLLQIGSKHTLQESRVSRLGGFK